MEIPHQVDQATLVLDVDYVRDLAHNAEMLVSLIETLNTVPGFLEEAQLHVEHFWGRGMAAWSTLAHLLSSTDLEVWLGTEIMGVATEIHLRYTWMCGEAGEPSYIGILGLRRIFLRAFAETYQSIRNRPSATATFLENSRDRSLNLPLIRNLIVALKIGMLADSFLEQGGPIFENVDLLLAD